MRKKWNLKITPKNDKLIIIQLDENGRVYEKEIQAKYHVYYKIKEEKINTLLENLLDIPWIKEVKIEEWFEPPWYTKKTNIVKVAIVNYNKINLLTELIEKHSLGERVNPQPSPFSLCLKQNKIVPLGWENEDPWRRNLSLPPIEIIYLKQHIPQDAYVIEQKIIEKNEERTRVEKISFKGLKEKLETANIIIADEKEQPAFPIRNEQVLIKKRGNPIDSVFGLIEISRLSYKNLDETASSSIGKLLTEIEALEAIDQRRIVPKTRPHIDEWRPIDNVIEADRGGLIGAPKPGIYTNIIQIDFSSLYPSIISKYNISPETINRPHCKKQSHLPNTKHYICHDTKGMVSKVVGKLVERREKLRKTGSYMDKQREKAIKWILVSSFGYLGYRNARFGNIQAYEIVTSIARETMKKAIQTSKENGYAVIHYIIDSLFIQPEKPKTSIKSLIHSIMRKTGFKIKIEAIYKWLIIPKVNKHHQYGAPNRYYGLTKDNKLIIKGARCFKEPPTIEDQQSEIIKNIIINNKHPRQLCNEIYEALRHPHVLRYKNVNTAKQLIIM